MTAPIEPGTTAATLLKPALPAAVRNTALVVRHAPVTGSPASETRRQIQADSPREGGARPGTNSVAWLGRFPAARDVLRAFDLPPTIGREAAAEALVAAKSPLSQALISAVDGLADALSGDPAPQAEEIRSAAAWLAREGVPLDAEIVRAVSLARGAIGEEAASADVSKGAAPDAKWMAAGPESEAARRAIEAAIERSPALRLIAAALDAIGGEAATSADDASDAPLPPAAEKVFAELSARIPGAGAVALDATYLDAAAERARAMPLAESATLALRLLDAETAAIRALVETLLAEEAALRLADPAVSGGAPLPPGLAAGFADIAALLPRAEMKPRPARAPGDADATALRARISALSVADRARLSPHFWARERALLAEVLEPVADLAEAVRALEPAMDLDPAAARKALDGPPGRVLDAIRRTLPSLARSILPPADAARDIVSGLTPVDRATAAIRAAALAETALRNALSGMARAAAGLGVMRGVLEAAGLDPLDPRPALATRVSLPPHLARIVADLERLLESAGPERPTERETASMLERIRDLSHADRRALAPHLQAMERSTVETLMDRWLGTEVRERLDLADRLFGHRAVTAIQQSQGNDSVWGLLRVQTPNGEARVPVRYFRERGRGRERGGGEEARGADVRVTLSRLGPISATLRLDAPGRLDVEFRAERKRARRLLRGDLPDLVERLAAQGFSAAVRVAAAPSSHSTQTTVPSIAQDSTVAKTRAGALDEIA